MSDLIYPPSRHLDLGCGLKPRNPYSMMECHGIDIRDVDFSNSENNFIYKKSNAIYEPIPYPDNFFDSVSAYDFLEHVPRVITTTDGQQHNAFINLMNEVFRVLKPGGIFFALTPCYPHPATFVDPTHVNFITNKTHEYFTGANPSGEMYGFTGRFNLKKTRLDTPNNVLKTNEFAMRKLLRRFFKSMSPYGLSHIVWEFTAEKNG